MLKIVKKMIIFGTIFFCFCLEDITVDNNMHLPEYMVCGFLYEFTYDQLPFLISNVQNINDSLEEQFDITISNIEYKAYTFIDSVFLRRKSLYEDILCLELERLEVFGYNHKKMKGKVQQEYYTIIRCAKTALGIFDLNQNNKLDYPPDDGTEERDIFRIFCLDIPSLNDICFDSLFVFLSSQEGGVNKFVSNVLDSLNNAFSVLKEIPDNYQGMCFNDPSLLKESKNSLNKLIQIVSWLSQNDGIDNDGDYYDTNKDGDTTVMFWIDTDGDKKIDVYSPLDTANFGHIHIGDSVHMFPIGVDSSSPPFYGLDTSLYEWVDTSDKDFRCYKYKGPYTYEFIGGDWGVDEEILDGTDNDIDGIIDEDTRISPDYIDNDNNGAVDKKIYDGIDNDGDGLIDEDVG